MCLCYITVYRRLDVVISFDSRPPHMSEPQPNTDKHMITHNRCHQRVMRSHRHFVGSSSPRRHPSQPNDVDEHGQMTIDHLLLLGHTLVVTQQRAVVQDTITVSPCPDSPLLSSSESAARVTGTDNELTDRVIFTLYPYHSNGTGYSKSVSPYHPQN